MNEYDTIWELALFWMMWFILGTTAAYIIFSLVEYFNGRED